MPNDLLSIFQNLLKYELFFKINEILLFNTDQSAMVLLRSTSALFRFNFSHLSRPYAAYNGRDAAKGWSWRRVSGVTQRCGALSESRVLGSLYSTKLGSSLKALVLNLWGFSEKPKELAYNNL